jgi:hypothetical protein
MLLGALEQIFYTELQLARAPGQELIPSNIIRSQESRALDIINHHANG